jgi:hypothetical protein
LRRARKQTKRPLLAGGWSTFSRRRLALRRVKVVERFTRTAADTIVYRFTIDDPATWVRPWTGEYPWVASNSQMYEYACHESNYALGGILRGARLLENERQTSPR